MKKIGFNIFIFMLLFLMDIKGQQITFAYLDTSYSNEMLLDVLEIPNKNILFCGRINTPEHPDKTFGYVVKLDEAGNFVDSAIINYQGRSISINNLFYEGNGQYILVGSFYDTLGTYSNAGVLLARMDQNLEVFDSKMYFFPASYRLNGLSSSFENDSTILAGSSITNVGSIPRPFLYEFNFAFDSLKANFYLDDYGFVSHMRKLSNGTYWFLKSLQQEYQVVDSLFIYVNEQKVPNSITSNYGVKWDSDTSFYLLGDKVSPAPEHNLAFIRQYHPLDTTGHIFNQWGVSDTLDFPAAWNGIDFNNKDSIFVGGTRNLYYWDPWFGQQPSWFIILQTDSMLNIRWERFYGGDAYYIMGKIIATQDGGCLIGGTRYDYKNETEDRADIIILKLNKDGIITGNGEPPAIEMREALVFPNPGTTEIKVRIAAQHPTSLFRLFDMNGRQVASEKITGKWGTVNTTFLKSGTYVYRITNDNGLFETGKWVKE